jgi:Flp pilus assembly protein TadD
MRYRELLLVIILCGAQAAMQQISFSQQNQTKPDTPTRAPTNPNQATTGMPTETEFNTDARRDIMVTGRLVMPDGMPPPDMVPVVLNCGGSDPTDNKSTMSDLRGEFRIRISTPYGTNSDTRSRQVSIQCSITVTIPGFESIGKQMDGLDLRAGADVGMLVLRPLLKSEGTTISLSSLKAPEAARQELMKAREDLAKQKLSSAKNRLEKAIRIYADYAAAWYELGRLQARQGETEQAASSYRQASKADSKYVSPLVELALMAATSLRWQEAEQLSESIIKMAPKGMPGVYLVHAVACFNQKKMDLAESSAREGASQDVANQFPKLFSLLGDVLLRGGETQGAVDAFRQYLQRAPNGPDAPKIRQRLEALQK